MTWQGWRRDVAGLLVLFAVSRFLFHVSGGFFYDQDVARFWYFPPIECLKSALLETIYYQNAVPPLFVLFVGAGLKLGAWATPVFHVIYCTIGFLLCATIYSLSRGLGANRVAALAGAGVFSCLPSTLVYEHYLFYTYPVALLLCASALFLLRAIQRGSSLWPFALTISVLALSRGVFHLAWVGVVFSLGLLLLSAAPRRRAVAPFVAALLIASLPYAKNFALYDRFEARTWFGMSLARMTLRQMEPELREQWVLRGLLDPIVRVSPFGPAESYLPYVEAPESSGVAAIDAMRKENGLINMHHAIYRPVALAFQKNALQVMKHAPSIYLGSVLTAFRRFFDPSTDWHPFAPIRGAVRRYESVLFGALHFRLGPAGPVGLMPFIVFAAIVAGVVGWRRHGEGQGLVFLYLALCILYVVLISSLFEIGENNRYRYCVMPLIAALLAHGGTAAWENIRSKVLGEI